MSFDTNAQRDQQVARQWQMARHQRTKYQESESHWEEEAVLLVVSGTLVDSPAFAVGGLELGLLRYGSYTDILLPDTTLLSSCQLLPTTTILSMLPRTSHRALNSIPQGWSIRNTFCKTTSP